MLKVDFKEGIKGASFQSQIYLNLTTLFGLL